MPTPKREAPLPRSQPRQPSDVPMRDLLAACAAATAVSTPPRLPAAQAPAEDITDEPAAEERDARPEAA
ncbi:hypothetical protein [Streptomyces sp. SP18CS02]|uniref:hypothetical protein n=1 Tax=Streptomyces sp. SP18CS02 TaxID=3002531 RepID=UPI002E7742E9|nr:hypothetical protein [Streptomyces sp. SP18CS02]MEE1756058.1 hypothetical protein [Streptomyces sp. SP18CS02]